MTDGGDKMAAGEAQQMYDLCQKDLAAALRILEQQMTVLQTRAQVLMTLAGVVVTVTGFSGRIIAGTNPVGKVAIVVGLFIVLASAIWAWRKVMSIKWFTSDLDGEPVDVIARVIVRRDLKTKAYKQCGAILCAGFLIYGIAVAQMLLFAK